MLTFTYPLYLPGIILLSSAMLALLIAYIRAMPSAPANETFRGLRSTLDDLSPSTFTILAVGLVAAMFISLSWLRHRAFATGVDLAIFDQATWLLSRGMRPFVTVRGLHAFGEHTSFILVAIAPLYWIFDTPTVLLVLQAAIVPVGAVPLYWIARDRLANDWQAVCVALAYLLHPATGYVMSFDFHADALAMPLVVCALYYGLRGKTSRLLLISAAAALCKEDIALTIAAMGLYLVWRGQRRIGTWTSLVAVAWFGLCMLVILPFFNSTGAVYTDLYPTAGSPASIARILLTRLLQPTSREFLTLVLLPVGGLAVLGLPELLIATPAILLDLLNARGATHSILYHYTAMIIPWVCLATIEGCNNASRIVAAIKVSSVPVVRSALCTYVLLTATLCHYVFGPSAVSLQFLYNVGKAVDRAPVRTNFVPDLHDASARAAIAIIPSGASVAAQYLLTPHLTHRQRLYQLPLPFSNASRGYGIPLWGAPGQPLPPSDVDYVILDLQDDAWPMTRDQVAQFEDMLARDPEFERSFERDGIALFKRIVNRKSVSVFVPNMNERPVAALSTNSHSWPN
jgi:uncharacterized membrane protein